MNNLRSINNFVKRPDTRASQMGRGGLVGAFGIAAGITAALVAVTLVFGIMYGCHCPGPWNHMASWMHGSMGHSQRWEILAGVVGSALGGSGVAIAYLVGRDRSEDERNRRAKRIAEDLRQTGESPDPETMKRYSTRALLRQCRANLARNNQQTNGKS